MSPEQEVSRSKGKKVELVIQQLSSLPTLPAVAARLLQITVKSDTQAEEVVRLIESDQSLASKIIALSTRANVGLRQRTASVSKAVVMLGFDAVRNAVLSIKVFETLGGPANVGADGFARMEFWKHSLAVACASKMLIKHINPKVDAEEAFVCGLLHDIGKVALDACLPKSFARVVQLTESSVGNIAEIEQKIMGIDHTIVGKRLAEKWQLPEAITETIWLHHQCPQALPEVIKNSSIVQTVYLADLLTREQRIGYSGNHTFTDSAVNVAAELGCSAATVEQVARTLRHEISERAVILGLTEMQPEELYHEALAEANSELARLNTHLQQQMKNLQVRSRYFELLRELNSESRPGQTVVEACSLVAELWQRHTACTHCAVYARAAGEMIFEGAMKLQENVKATVFMVDRVDDPDVISANGPEHDLPENFAITKVGQSHNWFFEQLAPMFDNDSTWVMPLRAGEQLVGALLWQKGEEQTEPVYTEQMPEVKVFAASAASAILQARKHEQQSTLCEQLAQSNRMLHDAQRELLQKRSMAAVGEMACGAAHEINNPLAVVVGRSQFLASSEENPQRKEVLEAIAQQGQEIAQIIAELMEFAKPTVPQPQAESVQNLISQAIEAKAEEAKRENVQLQTQLEDNLPDLFVDADQIKNALAELIGNGIESYQGQGGTIQITARYDDLNGEVILEIIDQGCGMDQDVLRKAFNPFFSSRRAGRRRGLGLSRTSRHIEENDGHLHLSSEPGKGTVARLVLPVSQLWPSNAAVGNEI